MHEARMAEMLAKRLAATLNRRVEAVLGQYA